MKDLLSCTRHIGEHALDPQQGGSGANPTTLRERTNWHIHLLYVRQQFTQCLKVIEEHLLVSLRLASLTC
jgi:hypothetical protein